MKKISNVLRICSVLFALIVVATGLAPAAINEVGDLNIIDDPGNPSDGLRYLDMSFSAGLTLAAALTNAQATYPNARVATPSEFNDLFASSGIMFNSALTAADAFTPGSFTEISSGANYNTGVRDALGFTGIINGIDATFMFTDPDGNADPSTTRDYIGLGAAQSFIYASAITPSQPQWGWLLVSEADTAPELRCEGFEPPLDMGPVSIRGNRALPFKAQLVDGGIYLSDLDIVAAPVIQIMFTSGENQEATDVTDDLLSLGHGTDGNQLVFTEDLHWQINKKVTKDTAPGTYNAYLISGDESEYVIAPTCQVEFVLK